MKTFRVQLPTTYNDGEKIPERIIENFVDDFLYHCGGISFDGYTQGIWFDDDNTEYNEIQRVYTIAVPEHKIEAFFDVLKHARTVLKQKAIFAVELGTAYFI